MKRLTNAQLMNLRESQRHARRWSGFVATLVALLALSSCAADIPVVGPKCGNDIFGPCPDATSDTDTAIDNDVATTDADASEVTPLTPVVNFYVETAVGNALESTTTTSAQITNEADLDATTVGVQVNVVVTASQAPDGSQVTLKAGNTSFGPVTLQGGKADFKAVTVACGKTGVNLTATVTSGSQSGQKTKALVLDCGTACQAAIAAIDTPCITTDGNGNAGFQYTFTVTTNSTGCTDAFLQFTDAEGKTITTEKVALGGASSAPVTATLSSKSSGLDGVKLNIIAMVVDSQHPDRGSEPSAALSVTLSTEAPVLAVQLPKAVTLGNDSDPQTPGIQLVSSGSATSMLIGSTVEIKLDGGTASMANLGADGTFPIALTLPTSKTYNIAIKATNSCGLSTSDSWPVQAFVDLAALTIATPASGAVLLAKDDQNLSTGALYETTFAIDVKQGTVDSEVSVFCRKAILGSSWQLTPVGKATVAGDGLVSVPVTLDTALLGTAISCRVTDGYGDFGAPNAALSAEITATVAVPAPCLTVVAPASEITLTTHDLAVTLSASNLKGATAVATITSELGVASDPQTVGTLSTLGLSSSLKLAAAGNLGDGTYTIAFEAIDAYGNKASDSAAVGLCGSVVRVVHIDTTGPIVAFSLPNKATLTTFDDVDSNPVVPGYQTDVTLAISDAVQVCITSSAGETTCKTTLPSDTAVTFASVTFDPGLNIVGATATDSVGNPTTAAPLVLTLVSQAPVVKFLSPKGNLTTIQDAQTFTAEVTQVGGAPVPTATTSVLLDGVAAPVNVSETSPGIYTFTITGLSAKPSTAVQFSAGAPGATPDAIGYSIVLTLTYKSAKPTIAVTAPTAGKVLNLASVECLPGTQDCIATVGLTLSDVEVGSPVQVDVTCGSVKQSYSAKATGNVLSLPGVALADQSTCTMVASVTDAAAQGATSEAVTVFVDRIAPAFGAFIFPTGKSIKSLYFIAADDIGDPTDNTLLTNLVMEVFGVAKDAKATLTVKDDTGKLTGTFTGTALATASDSVSTSIAFGLVSLPDGDKVQLALTVEDVHGNVGNLTMVAAVKAHQARVDMNLPSNVAEGSSCTSNANCPLGLCYFGACVAGMNKGSSRQGSVNIVGVPLGGTLRICSKAPGITGSSCATAGYKEVVKATITSQSMDFIIPAVIPDGVYTLIAEVSFGSLIAPTSSLSSLQTWAKERTILIDTLAPVVTGFDPPSAPGAIAACLNEASQTVPDGAALGGSFAFSVATSEDSSIIVVGNGVKLASGTATSTPSSLSVSLATEGTQVFAATATDLVGNVSVVKTLQPIVVDTQKPTGGFASPSSGKVILGSLLDVVVTSTAIDVNGASVLVKDAGVNKATETMSGGQVTFADTKWKLLTQGDHTLTADLMDQCGNTGVFGTTPSKVTVDLLPPTLAITAPAQAAKFGDKDDAAPSQGGYQVQVSFTTTDAATWKLELGSGCDATFGNCAAGFKQVAGGNAVNPGGLEAPVLVTIPFGNGDYYLARLSGTDVNGNVTVVDRGFQVTLSGCLVSLQGLTGSGVYNTQNCATPGKDCASVAVSLTATLVGPCGAVANVQLKKGSTEVGKVAPAADGKAIFNLTVADGDNTTVEAVALDGTAAVLGSSGALPLKADLSNPKVAFVAGQVLGTNTPAGGTTVNIVGKARDLNGSPNHQIHLQLQVTDSGLAGGKLTSLTDTVGATTGALAVGAPTLPVALSGTSQTIDLQFATLTEDATNTVIASVSDAAGNVGTGQVVVLVDWTPPAKLTLLDFLTADLNPRRPMAKINFAATGDNGSVGTATAYAVRYSKAPINTQADFDAACDASKVLFSTIGTPKASGTSDAVFVEGPDERDLSDPCKFSPMIDGGSSGYYFAVEAVDAAGNASPLSNTLSTNALRLHYANIVLGGAQKTTDMQQRIAAVGDLNGDGLGDFALGGGATSPLCIVYGRVKFNLADIDLSTPSAYPSHVCLANPGGLGSPIGKSGDVNGDGVDDLVVGLGAGTSNPRFVHVYLGKKGAAIAANPAVIVSKITNSLGDGVVRATTIGNFNGDTSPSGKPIHDIAISSLQSTVTYDRVVVIPGNPAWSDATPVTIDIDNPASLAVNNVATIHLVDQVGAAYFAFPTGVGNVLADGGPKQYDDLAIGQFTPSSSQALWIVQGRPLSGQLDLGLSKAMTTGSADATAVQVSGNLNVSTSGFGLYADTVNLDNDSIPDIALQHYSGLAAKGGGGIYWLHGAYLNNNLGKVVSMAAEVAMAGASNVFLVAGGYRVRDWHFGVRSIGNFADRPAAATPIIDLIHGRPAAADTGGNNRVVVRLGLKRPNSAIPGEVSFINTDLAIYDPANNTKTNWGVVSTSVLVPLSFAPVGDFNGDGVADVVIGSTDGSLVIVY